VHLTGRVEEVTADEDVTRIAGAIDAKYARFRTETAAMPDATRAHYARRITFRLVPDARVLTWDNARLELAD
jgi:hypothetical protein